jgi:stage II sporulation protein D
MFAQDVMVDLFRAKPPSDRIVIRAPYRMVEPRTCRGGGGDCEIRVNGRILQMYSLGRTQPIARAQSFTFAPVGRGITLRLGDAQRAYAGSINLQAKAANSLSVRNRVSMRDYVKSVVGSETDPSFTSEALKAQAVCVQTLMSRYKTGDPLTDTTEKQAYLGLEYVRPSVNTAVDAVFGKILMWHKSPANIYFHSTCAGGTSDGEEYFELKHRTAPYLHAVKCDYCRQSPFFSEHTATIPASIFMSKFPLGMPVVDRMDAQRRPLRITYGERRLSGFAFWTEVGQKLGWDKVPGTRFSIISTRDGSVTFSSTGAGHGVGLCQWGADGLARAGKSYERILEYYFPGASVVQSK